MAKPKNYKKFELPDWVKRGVITPIVLISVFLGGSYFQLNFPLFKEPEVAVEYNSATLTAHEKWQIELDTCASMRKIYGFIENETVTPEEVLALARVEQKVTAQVLRTWNDHSEGKKLSDDWYANATEVWASIIDITESYPYRNEPWLAELYPRLANVDEFKKYLVYGIESPANDSSVLWMVVLKRCVYETEEPTLVAPVVKKSPTDSNYCPIYAEFKTLNFNRPELAAVWAQNNLRTVNQLGQKSNSYTQLESSLSALLANFIDVQLTMPSQQQVDSFLDRAPLQILTNRIDLLCGA